VLVREKVIAIGAALAVSLVAATPSTALAHGSALAGCRIVSAKVVRRGVVRAVVRLSNQDMEGIDRGVYDYDSISGTVVVQNRSGANLGIKYVSARVIETDSARKTIRIRYYPRRATPRRIGFTHCHHAG
jgi:hypothetical protein